MSEFDPGRLIITATKNVHSDYKLSPQEEKASRQIADIFKRNGTQRNWIPIYVEEIEIYHYRAIANYVMLDAVKMAGIEEIYAIQVSHVPAFRTCGYIDREKQGMETIKEVQEIHDILQGSKPPARPKKIRRPKPSKVLANQPKYFVSEEQRIVYALLELNGQTRQKALDVTVKHYCNKAIAKEWRDNLAKIIDPENYCNPDAIVAMTELDEMYNEMIWWEESP